MPPARVLTRSSDGVLLHVHVTPGAVQTLFPAGFNEWRQALEARLHAPAQENKANEELLRVLAGFFHLRPQDLRITSGESSREKTVLLRHITEPQILKKLRDAGYELPRDP